jgi:uncharacterized protein (DUF2141 family)
MERRTQSRSSVDASRESFVGRARRFLASPQRRAPLPEPRRWVPATSVVSSVLALGLAVAIPRPSRAQPLPDVVVEIQGLRNEQGEVMAGLYATSTDWLREPVGHCHAPIRAGRARCVFTVIGALRYAVAGLHDENENRDMDRDFFGFPQEGYFFSNDARSPLGPPSFEAAVFSVPQVRPIVVHVRYGL